MLKPINWAALILCLPAAATAAGLNFQGARDIMQERADTLKMSAADIEQKRFNVKEARSLSGPKISLNAQQIEGRKDVHLGFDNPLAGLPGLPLPGRFSLDSHEDISGPRASIDMMWPIYTGGAISAKQKACLPSSFATEAAQSSGERKAISASFAQGISFGDIPQAS